MTDLFILCLIVLFLLLVVIYIQSNNNYFEPFKDNNNKSYVLPKTIYCYWDNLEKTPLIQAHINTWKRNVGKDWTIIPISKNNVHEYVSNNFMKLYGNLDSTRFSDFLRIYLLIKNGGVWIDASTIIIDGSFLDKYRNEMIKNNYDVCLYEYSTKTADKTTPYLENWFIMAPKNSKLLIDLNKEFNKAYNTGFLSYKLKVLMPSGVNLTPTIQPLGIITILDTYLMQHAIINYLMFKGNKYHINIKNANKSMFKIQNDHNWNDNNVINFIIDNNDWKDYYAIKLIGNNRKGITDQNKYIEKLNKF
ncbi:MAG: hypothetical protein Terrestrivirus1_53 [Terrestrivirus sp.]|uniref:Uncharacterized protein n=1 Tax=Terrestrivirus sp. TaxID=2487775 RepID=A0A3G4ZNY2_9VIRU|nr:MAG: hypothetical protein Terrestrivirus1_53 [Terrestrivirus sp.]